jgi:hypothetical protein
VRILLRLRKELTNPPVAPGGEDDGARMENIEEVLDSDMSSQNSQSVEAVEDLKIKERCGNVVCAPTARIASGWKSHPDSCR